MRCHRQQCLASSRPPPELLSLAFLCSRAALTKPWGCSGEMLLGVSSVCGELGKCTYTASHCLPEMQSRWNLVSCFGSVAHSGSIFRGPSFPIDENLNSISQYLTFPPVWPQAKPPTLCPTGIQGRLSSNPTGLPLMSTAAPNPMYPSRPGHPLHGTCLPLIPAPRDSNPPSSCHSHHLSHIPDLNHRLPSSFCKAEGVCFSFQLP